MHVPYSMDDSEPDLGCGFGGITQDDHKIGWRDYETVHIPPEPKPEFVFMTEMDLVKSDVFMKHIRMALKGKDRQIHELRLEILELSQSLGRKIIDKG